MHDAAQRPIQRKILSSTLAGNASSNVFTCGLPALSTFCNKSGTELQQLSGSVTA